MECPELPYHLDLEGSGGISHHSFSKSGLSTLTLLQILKPLPPFFRQTCSLQRIFHGMESVFYNSISVKQIAVIIRFVINRCCLARWWSMNSEKNNCRHTWLNLGVYVLVPLYSHARSGWDRKTGSLNFKSSQLYCFILGRLLFLLGFFFISEYQSLLVFPNLHLKALHISVAWFDI